MNEQTYHICYKRPAGISSKHTLLEFALQLVQTQSLVCPSRRQNRSPMISDCFHMLSKTVKKYNILSTEIVLAILSQHLFQVGGKGSENVHKTTSSVLVPLSPNSLLLTLKYNSEFFTFIHRPQCVVDVWLLALVSKWVVCLWLYMLSTILRQDKSFSFGVKVCSDICSLHMRA